MLRHADRATFRSNGDLSEMFRPQNFRIAPCAGLQTIGPGCAGFSNLSPKSAPNTAYLASERPSWPRSSGIRRNFTRCLGFIISNLARPTEHVVAFYNQRDTAAQWVEEGKGRDQVDPLSRLLRRQHGAPPASCAGYNPGNFIRTLSWLNHYLVSASSLVVPKLADRERPRREVVYDSRT
jgi:hypothetical protein